MKMPESAQPEASAPPLSRRGEWGRRFWRGGLLALALLLAFHQPVLRQALRGYAIHRAAREQVALSCELEGSVWTNLTLRNVRATSSGSVPIDSVFIEKLRVEYNLWELLRRGPGRAVKFYNLRNAQLALAPIRGNMDQKKRLLRLLRNILQQPAMYSDRAQIENFNLTVRTLRGTYVWNDIHALLDPVKPGYIRVGEATLPGIGSWRKLHSTATYANRHLVLRDFDIGKEIHAARLELDASHRDQGASSLSFEGTVFGGDLGLFVWERDISKRKAEAQLSAYLSGLPIEALAGYAGWKLPVTGHLKEAWLNVTGDPQTPAKWAGELIARVENGNVGGAAIGEASGKLALSGGVVRLEGIRFSTGENRLSFDGSYPLRENRGPLSFNGLEADFRVEAPRLAQLTPELKQGRINAQGKMHFKDGTLSVEGTAKGDGVKGDQFGFEHASLTFHGERPLGQNPAGRAWHDGFSGEVQAGADDIYFREFAAQSLAFNLPVAEGKARLERLLLDLNGKDKLAGEASVSLNTPFEYEARLDGGVEDIALFQPFFQTPVSGALQVNWHGTGQIALLRHTGEGRIALQHGFLGKLTGVAGELAGTYSPESVEISALRLQSDQGTLQAGVRLHDQRLLVEGLRLTVGPHGVLTGSLGFPLDLRTPTRPESLLPPTGALQASLTLDQIDLAQALPASRPGLAVKGTVQGSLTAGGTLAAPEITASLEAHGFQSRAAEQLAPGAGSATLGFKEGRLTFSGSFAQPGLSPLSFKGSMPLDLRKALVARQLDLATPLSGAIKLPPSSAGIFAPFLPGVRFLDGRLSVDAAVRGTLGHPVFSGGVALDLPAIRFQSANLPGINHFLGDLRFSGNELTFQRFSGDMAGGPFSVTGRIRLEPLADPQLDLRLQSQGTLLVRNDSLTLRTDSDLRITGPFSAAKVEGNIGITKSRFFREIEILPIGLPGRPAPKPAGVGGRLSTNRAPFRNWAYHVSIHTAEPFSVKGNLANGTLEANLHLGGTGLAPTLEGTARIENFVASLPFSRLTVDHGALYFSGNASLNPTLDIHGSSRIRDYNVNVYLYGTALEPQTLFTSEPSLPQEEVVALLATGATTRDFQQNNQALAGRAAALLFQDIYHKVFPRRSPLTNSANPMDRFSLDVGGVDPRTGKQELTGRLKLSNAYQIGAGVDMQGEVRMQLQYLIRFR